MSVRIRSYSFNIRFLSGESVPCPVMSVDVISIRWNFPPDKTDRDVRLMYGRYPLSYGLFGTRALHLLYLSGFYPLMSGRITKWHNSCNTDLSAPIFPFCCENLNQIGQTFLMLQKKTLNLNVDGMTDWQNDGTIE